MKSPQILLNTALKNHQRAGKPPKIPPKSQCFKQAGGSSPHSLNPNFFLPFLQPELPTSNQSVTNDIFHCPGWVSGAAEHSQGILRALMLDFFIYLKFKEAVFVHRTHPSCSQPSSWTMGIPRSSKILSARLDSWQGPAPSLPWTIQEGFLFSLLILLIHPSWLRLRIWTIYDLLKNPD